ncbi:putative F-box domain-containing protein [Helianthus anomalus]
MAEVVNEDVVEQILIEIDVKDLIRFKTVCKSWHSLITSPRFVSRHLNRSYNKDRNNNEIGHRKIGRGQQNSQRIVLAATYGHGRRLVGSSNGLVCIIIKSEFCCNVLVCNPSTREVRQLRPYSGLISSPLLCWGFGYDSSRDDYMVFVGARKGENHTCFHVLIVHDICLMKKYNVKESWEPLPHDREINYEYVHELTAPREDEDYILPPTSCYRIHVGWDYIWTPVFVPSLVSPHSNRSAKVGSIYYVFPIFFFLS